MTHSDPTQPFWLAVANEGFGIAKQTLPIGIGTSGKTKTVGSFRRGEAGKNASALN